ncbi:MAG TPA: ATP-binding cassette domain-containing protein [Planctomycetota bacterium]|nr:ATP-binding cassette domain-containing protein [Planctomycetota bacterium]
MSLLVAKNVVRQFEVYETKAGLAGAIAGLFQRRTPKIVRAVDDLSFSIEPGEVLGLIGANGAGKSTIVKMATGIIRPTSGSIELFGTDPFKHRIQAAQQYGVVFGQRSQLWWDLSPHETFRALISIYDLEEASASKQIAFLVDVLELKDFLNTPVRQLSLGQRVRCDIAAALIHEPRLIFLDEPTVGVDVLGKERLREHIRLINQERKVSVLLTSHEMADIERLCHRVIVIDKGRLAFSGALESLRETFGRERQMILELREAPGDLSLSSGTVSKREGNKVTIVFEAGKQSAPEILAEVARQYEVLDFHIREMPIDQVISAMYQRQQQARAAESVVRA